VVDFVDLQWWPVFNLADVAIVCGAVLLLLASMSEAGPEPAGDGSGAQPQR
jgi:signal peptidase II